MATLIPSASLFLGIIPALVLLLISVKGFEKTLKQKNIFLTFIVGLIVGFITVAVEIYTGDIPIYLIVLYPVFEELFKTIILNIRRLQEKPETVIYGLTLGLGVGAVATSASVLRGTLNAGDYLGLGLIVVGSCGFIMLQGSTGVLIGYGIYRGKTPRFVTFAIFLHMIYMVGLFFMQVFSSEAAAITVYLFVGGLLLYWYATRRVIPKLTVEGQRRKRTIKEIEIKNK